MRFLNRGAASPSDEKKMLSEIESLSRKLNATGAAAAADSDDRRFAKRHHVQVPRERRGGAGRHGEPVQDERRVHLRAPVSYPIRFIIIALPPLDGRPQRARAPVIGAKTGISRNLSRGGLLLATDVPVLEGS